MTLIAAGVVVLGVVAALQKNPTDNAAVQVAPRSPSAAAPFGGTYRGHGISFSYPLDWHEFFLADDSPDVAPAYGPVSGRKDEYVAVIVQHDTPSKMPTGMSPEAALRSYVGDGEITGPMQVGSAGGLPAYSVPATATGLNGQIVEGFAFLIRGEVGDFGLVCQYRPSSKAAVMAGCNMIRDTFREVPLGLSGGPGDCTLEQGVLLDELGLPEDAIPDTPRQVDYGLPQLPQKQCDEFVHMPTGSTTDVVGFYRARLDEGGWRLIEEPEVARVVAPGEPVISMVATRDFDWAIIEVYVRRTSQSIWKAEIVEGDVVKDFFLTVSDG